ncbi:MAG: hypothetical protein KIS94_13555 [Chitinophagales bacterium]|nr:hypothetical protein [Chitinophagales bacterium]
MKYNIEISEAAYVELAEAMAWYETQQAGLGEELEADMDQALLILQRNPFYEVRYRNLRVFNLERFPFQIIYIVFNQTIRVISFFHAHRDPEIWKSK